MADRFEVLLELPIYWSQEQADMIAERMLTETPLEVGVHVLTNGTVTEDLRGVNDA